jgi:alpha-methylacyl-CoA racemase
MVSGAAGNDQGPLAGIRVLELGGIGPGPFCAMMLANSGATILRIDRPSPGAPSSSGGQPERGTSGRSRQSVILDLQHPRGWTRSCGWLSGPTCCSRASGPG